MAAITTANKAFKAPWARLLSLRSFSQLPNAAAIHLAAARRPLIRPLLPLPNAELQRARRFSANAVMGDRVVQELLAEVEREKQREREEKREAGVEVDDEEEDEDYMGVGPLITKLETKKVKDLGNIDQFWEPTDSESDDDERFSPEEVKKRADEFEKKCKRHGELLKSFAEAGTGQ